MSACDPEPAQRDAYADDGFPATSGKADAAAVGALVLSNGGAGSGAVACAASGVCVAVVVVGLVVVGGVTLWALRPQRSSDYGTLATSPSIRVDFDDGTSSQTSGGYQPSFDARIDRIYQSVSLGATPITGFEEFAASTYSWQCEASFGGTESCIQKAGDFLNCISFGGGDACYGAIGGLAQYVFAASQSDSDDMAGAWNCAGATVGSQKCSSINAKYKQWCGSDQWSTLGCFQETNGRPFPWDRNGQGRTMQPRFGGANLCIDVSNMSYQAAMCHAGRQFMKYNCIPEADRDAGHETPIDHAEDVYFGCMELYEANVPIRCSPLDDADDRFDDLLDRNASNEYGC
ncbi:MAG: hypothetical protein AAGA54_24150 [Myxococcota bacterium]